MLSFSTEFPVAHSRRSTDFLREVQTWILGSPHTRIGRDALVDMPTSNELRVVRGNESIDTLQVAVSNEEAAGIRYSRRDDGLEWVTTVVFSRTAADSWVGIRVSCESSHPALRLPPAKKPVLVRVLLANFGGAVDGVLRVGSAPFRLGNSDIDLAARLINGNSGCRLPVVYVSAGAQGSYIVDADRLANDLAGMAHVVVEPNRPFSVRLKIDVDSENVYGGTVGVYWPDGGGRRSFFIGREFESPEDVERALVAEIQQALTNRRPFDRCTWAHVQEYSSRQAIQLLRASGSLEVDKYIETFDRELAAKMQRIDDANKEIIRLQAELRIYEARLAASTGSLLRLGGEQDHYPNEVLGIVRDAVADAMTRVPKDSRREHVLAAVLAASPGSEDVSGPMREQLKALLRGSRTVDAKLKRGLEDMGFTISEDGKHYKLVFQEDDRYTFSLAKSGSDHRGGLNAASDIGKLLF